MDRKRESQYKHHKSPSFSSSLLDSIYNSIDESKSKKDQQDMIFAKKNYYNCNDVFMEERKEKKLREFKSNIVSSKARSNSSDSSGYGGGGSFWSSETESVSSNSRSSAQRASKTIRTSNSTKSQQGNKQDQGNFGKTKLKALKIYADLKKIKTQPMSPGSRIASFLNSVLGNSKKPKISPSKSDQNSSCSSVSSFSRSCLINNMPYSAGKNNQNRGTKRSVRFCPVYEDEEEEEDDKKKKNISVPTTIDEELRLHILREKNRVEEVARDLLKNYCKNIENFDEEEEDDEDDDISCSSSDLFELDNLFAIGIERYREELPVYETTCIESLCNSKKK